MKSTQRELSRRIGRALAEMGIEGDPLLREAQDRKFGDYQSNCAMGIAKKVGKKPREVAQDLIARLDVSDVADPPEIAAC